MNKSELISKIADNNGFTIGEAKRVVEDVLTQISESVKQNGKVSLHGFGNFTLVYRKARVGRNPQTGKPLEIAAKKVVKFKAHF